MSFKKIKLTAVSLITLGFIIIFLAIQPNLSSTDFSLYNFSKGMLAGMSLVAAVVWLFFLISNIKNPGGINRKKFLICITTFCLLASTIAATYFSNNPFLLTVGAIIMCIAMILNISDLKSHFLINKKYSS